MRIKRKVLKDDIFKFWFAVQIGGDQKSFCEYFKKKSDVEINDDGEFAGLFTWHPKYRSSCGIWISRFEAPLISHEVTHAVNHVVEHLRIPTQGNNEFASYYHEWLTRSITNLGYKK